MKISPTEAFQPAAASGAGFLLVFLDEAGEAERWLLLDGGGVAARSEGSAPGPEGGKLALAVPGTQVTIHWLELAEGLTEAQAAAAARLMLVDASAEPIAEMHVAIGRPERGLTPAALVPARLISHWLANADADLILPAPLLLPAPEGGFVRYSSDYRGPAAAFTLEPELARIVVAGAEVADIGQDELEAALAPILAEPPINLRQGAFARRRRWGVESRYGRRIGWLVLALAVLSLAVEVATILSHTFAADRLEAEANALAAQAGPADIGPGFGASAGLLFEAVRTTPNVELTRLEYRPEGALDMTVMMDSPATLAVFRSRLEASGLRVEPGERRSAGGRPAVDLRVRPS